MTIIQAYVSEAAPNVSNGSTRIFNITDVTISGLIIRHGYVAGQSARFQIEAGGGGILNSGSLTPNEVVVTNNWASTGGGGIKNTGDGTLNIINSVVTNNSVHSSGDGGGIASGAGSTLIITNSAVSRHTARNGGGIFTEAGSTLIITTSAVTGNTAQDGGGIYAIGTIDLTNSTISSNTARKLAQTDGVGGGIWVSGSHPVNVTNSTISHNHALFGGGIASARLINSSAGLINSDDLNLTNTIVANPSGGGCHGSFISLGHSLDSDGSCTFQATGDISDVNPALGPLQDNGGPTFTHALLPGSPAIDHIPAENCDVATDQRGVVRPQGTRCDIGAYELEP